MYNPLPVVSLDIVKATKVITFNTAAELNLGPATLVTSSNAELAPVETKFDSGTERTTLIFAEELPAGSKVTLRVGFGSALTDSMTGYYKSTWEKGIYALTQFEVSAFAVCMYTGSGISRRFKYRSGVGGPKRINVQRDFIFLKSHIVMRKSSPTLSSASRFFCETLTTWFSHSLRMLAVLSLAGMNHFSRLPSP